MFGRRWRESLVERCCRCWMDIFGQAELRTFRHMEELYDTQEIAQYHQTSRETRRHHRFPERLSHQSPRKCKPVSPSHSPTISAPQTPPPAINHLSSSPHSNPLRPSHKIVQGIGMQQHSYPSHSMHFVFPAAPPSGFTIEEMVEEAAEPGPLRFTSWEVEEMHILMAGLLVY